MNDFHFENQTQKMGKALVAAEHVINVKEYQLDGPSFVNKFRIKVLLFSITYFERRTALIHFSRCSNLCFFMEKL